MFGFDFGGFFTGIFIIGLVLPLVMVVLILGIVFWTIRRTVPAGRDVAIQELRARFASGQIDQSEFEARMDALGHRS